MKLTKLSTRELVLLALLLLIALGAWYYMGFLMPLQNDMIALESQYDSIRASASLAQQQINSMNKKKAELDAILSESNGEPTEIAPYDNKEIVLNELNAILYGTDYTLTFAEPDIQEDGIVRRVVSMNFRCNNYENAKEIVTALAGNRWRCLVGNLSMSSTDNLMTDEVQVAATITFFESTKLEGAESAPATE